MELNREQIIKALGCWASGKTCSGEKCEIFDISPSTCDRWVGRKALALIKELTEENERLREKADRNFVNLKAVLEERNEKIIVAATVREFAERLTACFCPDCDYYGTDVQSTIDQIAKEMFGETK